MAARAKKEKAAKKTAPVRKKAAPRKAAAKAPTVKVEDQRFWLMYPSKLIQRPVIWELGHRFKVSTNIRQVSVTEEIGIVCLELDGERAEIKKSVKWLEKMGISVEPVEINVIES